MKRPNLLSASFVKTVREPGRYGDGRGSYGLSLLVKNQTNGRLSKSWSQRIRINGKLTNIGLGAYPLVSLADARQKCLENAQNNARGVNPRQGIPTYEEAAENVLQLNMEGWKDKRKSETLWRQSMADYVLPVIGSMPVNLIHPHHVLECLIPNWTSKHETMRKTRQRIRSVFTWAEAKGYITSNSAGDVLNALLPKVNKKTVHHKSLHYSQLGDALDSLQASNEYPATKACLQFIALTACRSGEARLASWNEINCTDKVWTIPAVRTKTGKDHSVPLSDQAMAILESVKDGSDLVFPSAQGKALTDNAISVMVKKQSGKFVPHGLRASFRDWCSETGASRELAEISLGHNFGSQVEAAYKRSTLLEQRRPLMQAWADAIS